MKCHAHVALFLVSLVPVLTHATSNQTLVSAILQPDGTLNLMAIDPASGDVNVTTVNVQHSEHHCPSALPTPTIQMESAAAAIGGDGGQSAVAWAQQLAAAKSNAAQQAPWHDPNDR